MNMKSIGQQLKASAIFTIGAQLTNEAIKKGREKYREYKRKQAAQSAADEGAADIDEAKSELDS